MMSPARPCLWRGRLQRAAPSGREARRVDRRRAGGWRPASRSWSIRSRASSAWSRTGGRARFGSATFFADGRVLPSTRCCSRVRLSPAAMSSRCRCGGIPASCGRRGHRCLPRLRTGCDDDFDALGAAHSAAKIHQRQVRFLRLPAWHPCLHAPASAGRAARRALFGNGRGASGGDRARGETRLGLAEGSIQPEAAFRAWSIPPRAMCRCCSVYSRRSIRRRMRRRGSRGASCRSPRPASCPRSSNCCCVAPMNMFLADCRTCDKSSHCNNSNKTMA